MSALAVSNLNLHHGLLHAVRDVSLSLERSQVLALVGANGAGKTTLLRAIAGTHRPTSGTISLATADITAIPAHRRVGMGVALVPEGRKLFGQMTVEENLLLGRSANRPGNWSVERILDIFPNLRDRRTARCATLSGGEQQATAIGRALMSNPDVLLLDEVSLGLSPLAVDRVYQSLAEVIASGTTILLVEQDLNRALKVANRVVCMLEGRVVLESPAEGLTREQVTDAYFGLGREQVPA